MPASAGTVTKSYVSATDFLDQRDIDPKLYDQSRDRSLTDIMKVASRYKPAKMFNFHNFVNNDAYEVATVSAVSSNGIAQIVFTVNTASGFPRVGDLAMISNAANVNVQGRVQAITTASGTATLTVRSVGGNSAPLWVAIGDKVTFSSNAFGEGSGAPTNRRYGQTKYFNLVQIFKEADDITDVQKVAKIEVSVGGDFHILPYQTLQKAIKLNGDISVQMIAGVQSSTQFSDANPFLADANGNAVQTTGGLNWYTTTYGISDQAAVLGTFSFTEIDQMIDNWIANKAPLDQMGFMASKSYRIISKYLKNLGSSGVTSVRLNIDGQDLNFNVDHLSYGGAEMDFIHLSILDHPQLFSSTLTPDISGSIFWVPKDQVETVDGGREGRIQIRYTPSPFNGGANGFSNGIIKEWRTGALAEVPTNSTATLHTDWYTVQGLECLGVKHFQKFRIV